MGTDEAERSAGTVVAGIVLGAGLGGFVDGIVLHQMLQWHHLLTSHGRYDRYPHATVEDLEDNTLWDGVFHAGTWLLTLVGIVLLWRALTSSPARPGWNGLVGPLLAGWGAFNLVEGLVSHHLLTLHHVRDDVAEPLWWDLGFLAGGAVLVAVGAVVTRAQPGLRR